MTNDERLKLDFMLTRTIDFVHQGLAMEGRSPELTEALYAIEDQAERAITLIEARERPMSAHPEQRDDVRRERAIEAARRASGLIFHSRSAAAAIVDAVLAVADKYEVERQIRELEQESCSCDHGAGCRGPGCTHPNRQEVIR